MQDIRNLYEHKKVIKKIFEKMNYCNEFIKEQELIEKNAYANLILCAKYNYKPSSKLIKHIYHRLTNFEKNQKELILKFVTK